jgi:hypothetical protein
MRLRSEPSIECRCSIGQGPERPRHAHRTLGRGRCRRQSLPYTQRRQVPRRKPRRHYDVLRLDSRQPAAMRAGHYPRPPIDGFTDGADLVFSTKGRGSRRLHCTVRDFAFDDPASLPLLPPLVAGSSPFSTTVNSPPPCPAVAHLRVRNRPAAPTDAGLRRPDGGLGNRTAALA